MTLRKRTCTHDARENIDSSRSQSASFFLFLSHKFSPNFRRVKRRKSQRKKKRKGKDGSLHFHHFWSLTLVIHCIQADFFSLPWEKTSKEFFQLFCDSAFSLWDPTLESCRNRRSKDETVTRLRSTRDRLAHSLSNC